MTTFCTRILPLRARGLMKIENLQVMNMAAQLHLATSTCFDSPNVGGFGGICPITDHVTSSEILGKLCNLPVGSSPLLRGRPIFTLGRRSIRSHSTGPKSGSPARICRRPEVGNDPADAAAGSWWQMTCSGPGHRGIRRLDYG